YTRGHLPHRSCNQTISCISSILHRELGSPEHQKAPDSARECFRSAIRHCCRLDRLNVRRKLFCGGLDRALLQRSLRRLGVVFLLGLLDARRARILSRREYWPARTLCRLLANRYLNRLSRWGFAGFQIRHIRRVAWALCRQKPSFWGAPRSTGWKCRRPKWRNTVR